MSSIIVFESGHAVTAASMHPVIPKFVIRKSTDVMILGCSKIESGDPLIYLSTVVEIDSEHVTSFGEQVDKKGNKKMTVVGRRRGAYRVSATQDELIHSEKFGELEEEVRDEAMKRIRNMAKWNNKYRIALAASESQEPVPATPVVSADEDIRERDPHYCEKRFLQNAAKLLEVLSEQGFDGDAVTEPCAGVFELLDTLEEKGIEVESPEELRGELARAPIDDIISAGAGIPNISQMIAAVNRPSSQDHEIVDQTQSAA